MATLPVSPQLEVRQIGQVVRTLKENEELRCSLHVCMHGGFGGGREAHVMMINRWDMPLGIGVGSLVAGVLRYPGFRILMQVFKLEYILELPRRSEFQVKFPPYLRQVTGYSGERD